MNYDLSEPRNRQDAPIQKKKSQIDKFLTVNFN